MALEKPTYELLHIEGRLELRRYEPYIVAETFVEAEFERAGNEGFRRLADYIFGNNRSRQKIAMTAPVEMSMTEGNNGRGMSATNMAFLYGDRDLGEAGRQGKVDVIDVPPMRVLSIGIRGRQTPEKVAAAKKLIEARLQQEGLERTGDWRLLGYNSPMVPNKNRFWELQAPIGR